MRKYKWRVAAVFALLPTVFGQLTPVYAADFAPTASTYPTLVADDELVSGNSITFSAPDWTGNPTPTVTNQWYSCTNQSTETFDSLPAGCAAISGATGNRLALTNALKAKFVMVGSSAANTLNVGSSVTRYSATAETAVAPAPSLKPSVLGANSSVRFTQGSTATQNSKYTVDLTGWVAAASYTYKWYRCDAVVPASTSAPVGCEEIIGAIGASYVVTANDVDKIVTSYVTAKNGTVQVAAVSVANGTTIMQSPVNAAPASVFAGTIVVGGTATALDGTWLASPSASFTYQWYSCTAAVLAAALKNAKCAAIAGQTSGTYLVSAAMNNKYLVVQVKATNAANAGTPVSSFSASSSKVLTSPTNSVAPKLLSSQTASNGQPIIGGNLTISAGTWVGNPAPTKTYLWYLCDSAVPAGLAEVPGGCNPIAGATGTSVATDLTMQGQFLVAKETATSLGGVKSLVTASGNALQSKPLFETDPSISGNSESGGTIAANSGASSVGGTPNETYSWAKCANVQGAAAQFPAGCTILPGQTASTLDIDTALEGYFLVARVTLGNVAGQTVRTTATSAQVLGQVVNVQIAKPTSTSSYVQLNTLVEANDGTWTGFPKPTFEYEWYRCDQPLADKSLSLPIGCNSISAATARTYTPEVADAANYLMVKVTAIQGSNRVSIFSPTSYQVLEAPSFTGDPGVGSQHVVGGSNLVPVTGGIRGTSDPRTTFSWYRCSAPVSADSAALAVGCAAISGATAASYAFVPADVGKYILASITLANELGSVKRFTSSSQLVNIGPANLTILAPVSATLPAMVGKLLRAGTNTWTGNPTATLSYQWFRCDDQQKTKAFDVPANCFAIGGQTLDNYTPSTTDSGKYLLVAVRGYNDHGSQTVYSPTTLDVADGPRFNRGPILNNLRDKGKSLEVVVSETAGWPTPSTTYRWLRCDATVELISVTIPAGCAVIVGATAPTYRMVLADVRKYVVGELKLKNTVGEVIRYTASSQEIRQIPEIAATVIISGNQWVGQTLSANGVSVVGYPTPVTTLQWLRCTSGTTDLTSCLVVASGSDSYLIKAADRGSQIAVRVSSQNVAGSAMAASLPTSEINMPPKLVQFYPTVTGTDNDDLEARAATTINAFEGLWDASPAIEPLTGFKYQWYSCSLRHPISTTLIPPDCLAIKGQIATNYLVKATDKDRFLGFSLKVTNGTEDVTQFSATTARVYVVPLYMAGAKTSFAANQAATDGSPRIGYEVEANEGTWQGSPTPTYTYQWFSCTRVVSVTSDLLGDYCQVIVGATNRVFSIGPEQLNTYLGVMIRGGYKSYFDEVYSPTTVKTVVSPPVNTVQPRITSRFTYVESTLKTTEGVWVGTPAPKQVHSWWECDQQLLVASEIQPAFCRELAASNGTWKVTANQNGKYLASLTTSTNTAGVSKIWSASTDQITTGSVNLNPPTVNVVAPGTAFAGSLLASTLVDLKISDALAGDWAGTPTPDLSVNQYSWYRCAETVKDASDSLNSSCQLIENNASTQTYRPIAEDVGKFLIGAVKNDNGVGASIVYSASTETILQPPNNTIVPNITGKAFVDQPVSGDKGAWDGLPAPTFQFQWLACSASVLVSTQTAPTDCAVIDNATTATFSPTDELLGKFLVFRVTATNKVGEQVIWSASTSAVVSGPVKKKDPKFTYPPTNTSPITRLNPIVGQEFTTDGGEWKGVPEPLKTFEWFVCPTAMTASATAPTDDKKCEVILGSNSRGITPLESSRGKFLLVHVHAVNENGEADFYSATTTVVWMAPAVDHVVAAVGTSFHRLTVKAKLDTWKAFPDVTKTYEWFVCPSALTESSTTLPAGCALISGATSNKYKIPDASVWPHTHEFLVVKVRATNSVDSSEHYSATSGEILVGPVNERAPAITGTAHFTAGSTALLTGNAGTWSPVDSTLSYQWFRCETLLVADDELDPKCESIQGAIALNYQLTEQDPGKSLVLAVTGEKNQLRSTSYSASTVLVTERARNVVAPSISGVPKVNETSTGIDGDWRGFPTVSKTRTWYSCTSRPLASSATLPATCKLLSGATTDTLTNDVDLIGKFIVYAISGSNKVAGVISKVTVYSAGTEAVADPPVFLDKPTVVRPTSTSQEDAPTVGSVWSGKTSWTNKYAPTSTYQWYSCLSGVDTATQPILTLPSDCEAILAAANSSYTIRIDDRNKYLLVGITGTNAVGSATQFSNTTDYPVAQAPVADPLPSISGNHNSGSTLTIDPGVWTPLEPAPTITYNWYSCPAPIPTTTSQQPPASCTNLSSTGLTYRIGDLDNGNYITAQVVGTSASGRSVTSYLIAVTDGTSKAPVMTTAPVVTGDAYLVGMILTAARDQWDAMPAPTKTYQWYHCVSKVSAFANSIPNSCQEVAGAIDATYQMDRTYTGEYMLVRVTASNGAGSATVYSASTDLAVVAGYEPNTSVQVDAVGNNTQITAASAVSFEQTVGTWTHGNDAGQPLTNHRWIFCSEAVVAATSRFPATCEFMFEYSNSSSHQLDQAEADPLTMDFASEFAGYYISSIEYVLKPGSNPRYDTFASRQAFRVAKSSARVTIAPRIWDDNLTFTEPTVTQAALVGSASSITQVAEWQNDTDPLSLAALNRVSWRGVEAGTFSFQWYACSAKQSSMSKLGLPFGCENISGENSSTFTPGVNEVRKYLGVQITATNSAGSASIWTKTSEKVNQRPTIVAGSEPSLNSITFTQDIATVNKGVWQGEPTPTFKYQWMSCQPGTPNQVTSSTTPAGCINLGSTTTDSAIVVPSLGGRNLDRKLVVQVIATNRPNFADPLATYETRASATSGLISEKPYFSGTNPVNLTSSPTTAIFSANVGETITMTNDQSLWFGTPIETGGLAFSYSWYTCTLTYPALNRTDTLNNDCAAIANETGKSLILTHSLAGQRILGKIVAFSAQNSWYGYATTATTAQVAEKPYSIRGPLVSSSVGSQPLVSSRVSVDVGAWDGFPMPTLDNNNYWWFSCDTAVTAGTTLKSGCVRIPNLASNTSFTPSSEQAGKYLVFSAAAVNRLNPVSPYTYVSAEDRQYSAGFGPTLMAPEISFATPVYAGTPHSGQTLTTSMPSVKAYPQPSSTTFEWYSCPVASAIDNAATISADCIKIGNTNQTSITVDDTMAGRYIEIYASSTNTVKSVRKNTIATKPVTRSPTNEIVPTISGTALVNGTNKFSATAGRWSATPSVASYTYVWYLCSTSNSQASSTKPSSCATTGAAPLTTTPSQILLTRDMAGKFLVLEESATQNSNNLDANKSSKIYSASSSEIMSQPQFDSDITISGYRHVDEELTANPGTISGNPAPTTATQWYSCTSMVTNKLSIANSGCTAISGATSNRYTVTSGVADRYLTVSVIATSGVGTAVNYALSGSQKVTQSPTLTSAATLRGDTVVGVNKAVTVAPGTWSGTPAISKTYNWYYCASEKLAAASTVADDCVLAANGSGLAITAQSLPLVAEYRGKYIVAVELASNISAKPSAGTAQSVTASIGPILMAPIFSSAPTVSGIYHVGQTLVAQIPAVTGYPETASSYEWWACQSAISGSASSLPTGCTVLSGLGNADLVITYELAGKFISVAGSNTNDAGSSTKSSTALFDVTQSPLNTADPSISGQALVGAATPLSIGNGSWTSAPTATASDFSYAWYQCSVQHSTVPTSLPADCAAVPSQSASTLLPTNAMAGKYVLGKVTLTVRSNKSQGGTASVFTASTDSVRNRPQFGSGSPTISGIAHLNETLTATLTVATGNDAPISTYEWWACTDAVTAGSADITASCAQISGSNDNALTISSNQVGKRIAVLQTATNSQGFVTKSSATTAIVSATATNTAAPQVSGTDIYSTTAKVSVTSGTWSGSPAPVSSNYTYLWYTCTNPSTAAGSIPSGCTSTALTTSTIALNSAWSGKYLITRVSATTATNKAGTEVGITYSASFGPIRTVPTNTAAPAFSPTSVAVGRTITASVGAWSGTGPISTSYRWYNCPTTATISATTPIPSTCSVIAGFDNQNLVVPSTLSGKKLLLAITATNSAGSTVKSVISTSTAAAASISPLALRAIL